MATPTKGSTLPAQADTRVCGFCGFSGKLTNEDIWPQWARKLVEVKGADHGGTVWAKRHDGKQTVERAVRSRDLKLITTKRVCATCNNGWMSDLENRAQGVLTPMVLGKKTILGPESCETIATWAYMKCFVVALARDSFKRNDPLRRFNETRVAPRSCAVIIGRYVGSSYPLYACAGGAKADITIGDDITGQANVGYLATLSIGQFVVQVYDPGIPQVVGLNPSDWKRDASCLVWPEPTYPVKWPPVVRLTDATLQNFATMDHPTRRVEQDPRPYSYHASHYVS